jgi:hypothetical protein
LLLLLFSADKFGDRLTFPVSTVPIVIWRPGGRIILTNNAFAVPFEYAAEELMSEKVRVIISFVPRWTAREDAKFPASPARPLLQGNLIKLVVPGEGARNLALYFRAILTYGIPGHEEGGHLLTKSGRQLSIIARVGIARYPSSACFCCIGLVQIFGV